MRIENNQFRFKFTGHGHYLVEYVTTNGRLRYSKTITDMELIDTTKSEDTPKQKDLIALMKAVKR